MKQVDAGQERELQNCTFSVCVLCKSNMEHNLKGNYFFYLILLLARVVSGFVLCGIP
jgi:hypothetical protein